VHFHSFKTLFKQTSKQVILINKTFRLLMSFVFILLLLEMLIPLLIIFSSFVYGFAKDDPALVRTAFWKLVGIFMIVVLMIYIILQIIHVNDESKATIMFINDFVTPYKHNLSPEIYRSVGLYLVQRNQI